MENELMISHGNSLALVADKKIDDLLKPLNKEIFLIDTYLAGFGRAEDQTTIDSLKKEDVLFLIREEDFLDDYAILVMNNFRQKVGYIREEDNIILARLMDAGKRLTAKVKSVDSGEHIKKIRISISLVDF